MGISRIDIPGTNNPGKNNVVATLHELADDIQSGKIEADVAFLLFGDTKSDMMNVGFRNAGCKMTTALALLRIGDTLCQYHLGYILDPDELGG